MPKPTCCFVPMCKNSTKTTPEKKFITVPRDTKVRLLWYRAAHRALPIARGSGTFCCQDHLNLEEDLQNYRYFITMGGTARLKPGVLPHIFHCQGRGETNLNNISMARKRKTNKIPDKENHEPAVTCVSAIEEILVEQDSEDDSSIDSSSVRMQIEDGNLSIYTPTAAKHIATQEDVAVPANEAPQMAWLDKLKKHILNLDSPAQDSDELPANQAAHLDWLHGLKKHFSNLESSGQEGVGVPANQATQLTDLPGEPEPRTNPAQYEGSSTTTAPTEAVYIVENHTDQDTDKEILNKEIYIKEDEEISLKEEMYIEENALDVYTPTDNTRNTHGTRDTPHVYGKPGQDLENSKHHVSEEVNARHPNAGDDWPPREGETSLGREIKEELREMKEFMKDMSLSLRAIQGATKDIAETLRLVVAARNGIR